MRPQAATRVLSQEILAFGLEFADRQGAAEPLEDIAGVMLASGRPGQAARLWAEAVRLGRQTCPFRPSLCKNVKMFYK